MPRNVRASGLTVQAPNPGAIMQAQLEAAENATRIAGAACNYAVSVNRAWLELWTNSITQFTHLPRRLADMQRELVEEAIGDFQESMQQFGEFAVQASEEAEDTVRQSAKQMAEFAEQTRPQLQEGSRVKRDRRTERNAAGERRGAERRH